MLTPAEWAIQSRRRQHLPDHLEDDDALAELAELVISVMQTRAKKKAAA
jgi:hypothetical protein